MPHAMGPRPASPCLRFDGLASMQHLQQLTLRLPAAAWGGSLAAACGALQVRQGVTGGRAARGRSARTGLGLG